MLNSKKRAELRKFANTLDTIFQVGKDGVTDAVADSVGAALKARELIKGRVQDASEYSAREAAAELAERLGAETVQVIGSRFVLYKRNRDIDKYGI